MNKKPAKHAEFGERLRRIMKIRNVAPKELDSKAKIGEKSRRDYLAGRSYPKPGTLKNIAEALNVTVEQLENSEAFSELMFRLAADFDKLTFDQMRMVLSEADNVLLRLVRSLRLADLDVVKRGYQDLLTGELARKGLDLAGFLNRIHDPKFIGRLLKTLPSEPPLVIAVGENFERVDFVHNGEVVLPMPGAKLLWDCCCRGGGHKSPECRIHADPMGNFVTKLFRNRLVRIQWGEMTFLWRWCPELWPPSVDAFFFMECLEKAGVTNAKAQTVLDVGSGTGFLGIALAKLNPNIKTVVLSDWLLTPALFGQLNWRLNAPQDSAASVTSRVALYTEPPNTACGRFDLVVCNPPYLPSLPGSEEMGLESTVFGTDLLEHVIQRAKTLGERVFVQYSHLAESEAKRAAGAVGVTLKTIGSKKDVPFRVPHAFNQPKYIESLVRERKLRRSKGRGHLYFHDLRSCEVV